MEIRYEDYESLIAARAWAWHKKIGWKWDIEDLIAEGNLVFCNSLTNYNPSKSSFCTYLYNSLQMHFGNIINTGLCQKAEPNFFYDLSEVDGEDNKKPVFSCANDPETETIFRQIIRDLPSDSKEVVQAIFETPVEIIEALGIKKITKHAIFQYFTKFRGWPQNRVWKTFSQIQKAMAK